MSEYTRTSFKTQKNNRYSDALPSGSTTRANHRDQAEDVADSFVSLNDLNPVTASGTATYTATLVYDPGAAYANPNRFYLVKFTSANTGPSTIDFNSRGAKSIVKNGSTPLGAGDIPAGSVKLLAWDGTNFQIVGISAENLNGVSFTSFYNTSGLTGPVLSIAAHQFTDIPNSSLVTVEVWLQLIQTSGTAGSSGIVYNIRRSFRRTSGGTVAAIAATSTISSANDTGDAFLTAPTINVGGSSLNLEFDISTSAKTFTVTALKKITI